MSKVKIYSTPTCVYCVTLKRFLQEKNISFEEVDVSEDKEAADEMIEKTGQMGVPVVEIDDEVIVGFDRDKISKLLNL
jgi:glutaredoxin 3